MNSKSVEVLQVLRLATKELHAHLDANLPLAASNPTLADYGEHLVLFNIWLNQIGQLIGSDQEAQYLDFCHNNDRALNLIRKDLHHLDLDYQDPQHLGLTKDSGYSPPASGLPALNPPFLTGVDYVVKGSALGTVVLYNKVNMQFPSSSFLYMQDSALHGKTRWQAFLSSLALTEWSPINLETAQEGAIWAFKRFMAISQFRNAMA